METDDRRIIVIESGPAGAMAAWSLLQQGLPVTLLESGRAPPRGLRVRAMGRDVLSLLPRRERLQRHVASGDPTPVWHCELAAGGCRTGGLEPRRGSLRRTTSRESVSFG